MFGIGVKKQICSACGDVNKGKDKSGGSCLIELVLWCAMILPGLIYTLWRMTATKKVCTKCGQETLIPLKSPMGQKLLKDLSDG